MAKRPSMLLDDDGSSTVSEISRRLREKARDMRRDTASLYDQGEVCRVQNTASEFDTMATRLELLWRRHEAMLKTMSKMGRTLSDISSCACSPSYVRALADAMRTEVERFLPSTHS